MSKIIYLLAILFVPLAFANDNGHVNQNTEVWCAIQQDGVFLSVNDATITIYNPNNNIYIDNQTAQMVSIGLYKYEFVPNQEGNWLMYCDFYNATAIVGQATQSLTIRPEIETMNIYGMFFLLQFAIVIGIFLYNVFNLMTVGSHFRNYFSKEDEGKAVLNSMGMVFISFILIVLSYGVGFSVTMSQALEPIYGILFQIETIVVFPFVILTLLSMVLIYLSKYLGTNAKKISANKSNSRYIINNR